MARFRNPNEMEKYSSTPNWVMARRVEKREDFPIENYFDHNSGELTPAVVEGKVISRGLPENVIKFDLLRRGQHPLIVLAERRELDPQVEEAFMDLMANLHIADYWEELFVQLQTKAADLYVIDRGDTRYIVRNVTVDPFGSGGVLNLQPLGRRGRHQKRMKVDVEEAHGFMLPVIVYNPYVRR